MSEDRDGSVERAAEGIFGMLTEDFVVGDQETEKPTGESEPKAPDAGDEKDDEFDAEGVAALTDSDDEADDDDLGDESDDDDSEDDEDEDADGDEENDELDDESDDDEDDEIEPDDDEDPLVPIKIDGKIEQIPTSEVLASYSRTASWTKKS